MKITVEINKCSECRHSESTGAFTPGGRIYYCSHYGAPDLGEFPSKMKKMTKEIANDRWGPCKLDDNMAIPSWCPVKAGGMY